MYFTDPNHFPGNSDNEMIQAAIDEAHKNGCNKVVIPRLNTRTQSHIWVIEKTIEIPSHMYIEINNAHLRMADGVFCQMFRNSLALTDLGKTEEGLQEDIIIQGVGRALLDGGKHNGLREGTQGQNGMPTIFHNLTIYLHNVRNFKIDGLTIRDQRWWAIAFTFAWNGIVSNMHFEITEKSYRANAPLGQFHPWKNQDGIDLRIGCHDIQIRNITGETCDDIVALTALANHGNVRFEDIYRCEHLSPDIYNVTIQNITGFCNHCAMIRLLCHFRNQVYNISIDNILDASPKTAPIAVNDGQRTATCVKIGEFGYHKGNVDALCRMGEMRNISISNVYSSAYAAIVTNVAVKNLTVKNVFVNHPGRHAFSASRISGGKHVSLQDPLNTTALKNILIDGVYFESQRGDAVPFFFDAATADNFIARNIHYGTDALSQWERCEESGVQFEHVIKE